MPKHAKQPAHETEDPKPKTVFFIRRGVKQTNTFGKTDHSFQVEGNEISTGRARKLEKTAAQVRQTEEELARVEARLTTVRRKLTSRRVKYTEALRQELPSQPDIVVSFPNRDQAERLVDLAVVARTEIEPGIITRLDEPKTSEPKVPPS